MFPVSKQLNTHTELGQIQKYLQEKELGIAEGYELSDALSEKLKRIEFIKENLPNLVNEKSLAKELQKHFGISKAQAYFDLDDAKKLYGEQQIWADSIFRDLQETRAYAKAKKDVRGLNANDKNKIEAIARFKGDKQTEIFKSWTPPTVVVIREAEPMEGIDKNELEKEIKLLLKPKGKGQELDFEEAEIIDGGE